MSGGGGEPATLVAATESDRAVARGEWRVGWRIVAAGMLGVGCGPGLYQNVSSLFNPGMMAEFGWSRGDIATAAGVGLLGALAAPVVGRLVDRIGVRIVIVSAMLLLGVAYLGLSRMTGPLWQLRVLIGALALSVPGTSAIVYGRLVAAAFVARRGTALGVIFSGLSLLTIVVPPLLALVIAVDGWRGGFVTLAVFTSVVALPLVLLLLPREPSRPQPLVGPPVDGVTCREAITSANFWRLAVGVMLINMATVGLVSQLVPFGMDRGLSAARAAFLLTSIAKPAVRC